MSGPTTHYLNSDFDLSLRPRARQHRNPRLVRQVRELTAQALLGAEEGDRALLRVELPPEFVEHLAVCGLPLPRLLRHPEVDPATSFRPFGWSAEAIELNGLHQRPAPHPRLPCVRRVNSRSFARELEAKLTGETQGHVIESPGELETVLSREPGTTEWVIKAEHGNAGLANRRVKGPRPGPAALRFVEERLAEDDRLVVEPWRRRERDWCLVFDVPYDETGLRVHEQLCTADGALIGSLFEPAGDGPQPWAEELAGMAWGVAKGLREAGYFGPVCVDAFSWRDGERTRLRSLVDLNCRRPVSDGAWRLWRCVAPDRALYYRFFNRTKLTLPGGMAETLAALGSRRYDPSARRGILLASPLGFHKLAVVFVADDRARILELERWFRDRFEG